MTEPRRKAIGVGLLAVVLERVRARARARGRAAAERAPVLR